MVNTTLSTTKKIKPINQKTYAKASLGKISQSLVVHIVAFETLEQRKMKIHLLQATQVWQEVLQLPAL